MHFPSQRPAAFWRDIVFGVVCVMAVIAGSILVSMSTRGATFTQAVSITGGTVGGISCAFGPPIAAIPAAAHAAGFNTCVMNMDLSNPTSFTYQGATVSWTNINTWMDCKGASQPLWLLAVGDGSVCADFNIITDTDGKTSLASDFTPAEYAANVSHITNLQSATPWMFPNNIYYEDTKRIDQNTLNNPPTGGSGGVFFVAPFWGAAVEGFRIGGARNWVEWDGGEWTGLTTAGDNYNNQSVAGEWTTDGTCGGHCGFFPVVSACCARPYSGFGSYNVDGMRVTSDTSGNLAICAYTGIGVGTSPAQNTPTGCQQYTYASGPSDPAITNTNYILYPYTQIGVGGWSMPATMRAILRRIVIFSCSTWQTTACNTGVVTSNP